MRKRSSSSEDASQGSKRKEGQRRDAQEGRCRPDSPSRREFLGKAAAVTAVAAAVGVPSLSGFKGAAAAAQSTDCPAGCEQGPLMGVNRADTARKRRVSAADYERNMPIPLHPCNGDEQLYAGQNFIGSFTKALPHPNPFGEVDSAAYCALLRALASGLPNDFEAVPLGCNPICLQPPPGSPDNDSDPESRLAPPDTSRPRQRRLQNPQAGYNFDLEGKDYHQLVSRDNQLGPVPIAFPSAFTFASPDEAVEIVENYWQALTRDVPFANYNSDPFIQSVANDLNKPQIKQYYHGPLDPWGNVSPAVYSRGILPGDLAGPFLSQLLLRDIPYGQQTIPARIKVPLPNSPTSTVRNDFMTTFSEWLNVQNGCTPSRETAFDPQKRFIRSGRDLAEYVHNDAIYQAYFNAALLLMLPPKMGGLGARLDSNNPYLRYCKQENFVEFGPSQLLSLIGEVSVRAHKAVWYQKWQVHRRLRPEEFGARVHFKLTNQKNYPVNDVIKQSDAPGKTFSAFGSYFLPQAFPEGSPVHPSYGAGHATLAGACVTILKAWFDEAQPFCELGKVLEPNPDGLDVHSLDCADTNIGQITVGGELNKLASNIAIARNIAGVHWRSDYTESVFLGEKVAIQLLEDYGFTYNEDFAGFHLTDFNGGARLVGAKRTS
ncbi:MAG: vanadium-dependent haloperoxidase [Pyrinomonadaceae bacterium]